MWILLCRKHLNAQFSGMACNEHTYGTLSEAAKLENEPGLGRQENGRPRRRSAMNSLYYHSSLQISSYKLAQQAATISVSKHWKHVKMRPIQCYFTDLLNVFMMHFLKSVTLLVVLVWEESYCVRKKNFVWMH